MRLKSQKGGVVLKIVAVISCILLILAIEVPKRSWKQQAERRDIARNRMLEMSDCEIVYMQEAGSFSKDLKSVFDYATKCNTLKVSAPDIEIEILDIDTTSVRISFSALKHFKDLDVVPKGQELENIENKQKFIAFMESIGCPTAELVMESDAEQIDLLLKDNPNKTFYRSLKEKFYKSSENETEVLYNAGRNISITLKGRNPKLALKSNTIRLSSDSNIEAIANYKGKKDIFWDFVSKDKITVDYKKDPALDEQMVNMAQYVFSDTEKDPTPYLCPSTLEPFTVNFNLSAQVGMNVTFFRNDYKDKAVLAKDKTVYPLNDNPTIQNYFLNIVKSKSERKVADLVREYEMDGDSTYSSDKAKAELFTKYFAEQLKELTAKEPLIDEVKKSIDSPDFESETKFSEKERFGILFDATPGEQVAVEMKNEQNLKSVADISFFYSTEIIKIDTISVKISSPVNENSVFNGYKRNFFQNKWLFGTDDDENAGYVDNGSPSWKTE